MLRINDLKYSFNGKYTISYPDIFLKDNSKVLIIGDSGVGKTTLLHLIAGILSTQYGNICINDVDITKLSTFQKDNFRSKNIGLIFQTPHFIYSLNVLEHLQLIQKLVFKRIFNEKIIELLEQLEIKSKINENPKKMSVGERQRLSIAMALIHRPKLILADEPTSSLDNKNCSNVADLLIRQAQQTDSNLMVITHDERLKSHFSNVIELKTA